MRETFTYGSVRGAAGNGGPYRDQWHGLLGPAYKLNCPANRSPLRPTSGSRSLATWRKSKRPELVRSPRGRRLCC